MLTVERNPEGFGPEYLRCLNACFPHWGGDPVYRWCFERPMSGLKADQMVVRLDGEVVAGSAVSYRTVGFPNGRTALAGIMTGSWTLPAARGQGCFSRVIAESVTLAAERGCAALLAFVTEDNPSCRQLRKAGSLLVPTYYLFSDGDTKMPDATGEVQPEDADPGRIEAVARSVHAGRADLMRFIYPTAQEFSSQFLERPTETSLCQTADGALGVLERAADTDRLQLLLPSNDTHLATVLAGFLRHSLQNQRKLFLFSTRETVRDTCLALGMRVKNGYLTMLPAEPAAWDENFTVPAGQPAPGWHIESGDRI